MAPTSEVGKDGQYRMVVESKYNKLAKTRTDAKIFAVLLGFYGILKLGLASLPSVVYGEKLEPIYVGSVVAILFAFALFAIGSGGGKPHLEKKWLLGLFIIVAASTGTKAILDAFNNPLARATLMLPSPQTAQPYDQAVAKLLVQKLNLNPRDAVYDVDVINFVLDAFGSFALLAAAAATFKFLLLRRQPGRTVKKES